MADTLLAMLQSAHRAVSTGEARTFGVEVAIVTEVDDEQDLGRVKVCFPRPPGAPDSQWVRVAQPAGEAGRGFSWLPHLNDEVLVAFEHGDAHRPYVVGSLWSGKNKPAKDENSKVPDEAKQGAIEPRAARKTIDCEDLEIDATATGKIGITFDVKVAASASTKVLLCLLLTAAAARAGGNDPQLYLLGHPDDLGCTRCDGSPGDVPERGDVNAQARFHRFASTLGLAFIPPLQEPAGTTGQSGFEIGFSLSEAYLKIPNDAWATSATRASGAPPRVLGLPTVALRKGLGGSVEIGAAISSLLYSQMLGLTGELRWAPVDGVASAPDVALRLYATRVVGAQELDLTVAGADLSISKSFGLAGMLKVEPYAQGGVALVNALSSAVDFKPSAPSTANPSAHDGAFRSVRLQDNRYLRGAAGLRVVAGAVVLAIEGSGAGGTNPIQSDALPNAQCAPGSCKAPREYVRLWSTAARLGLSF